MASIKRMINEDGIVLEKIFKPATNEFKTSSGEIIAAQPDRYILRCVSGEEYSKDVGFVQSTVLDYKTDELTYDKAQAYSAVTVRYEVSNFGAKAVSVEVKDKGKI